MYYGSNGYKKTIHTIILVFRRGTSLSMSIMLTLLLRYVQNGKNITKFLMGFYVWTKFFLQKKAKYASIET